MLKTFKMKRLTPIMLGVSGLALASCSTSENSTRYGGPVYENVPCCETACDVSYQACGYVEQYYALPPVQVMPEPPAPPPPPVYEPPVYEPPVYVPEPEPVPCPPDTIRSSDGTCIQIEVPPPPPVSWPEPPTQWTPPPILRK